MDYCCAAKCLSYAYVYNLLHTCRIHTHTLFPIMLYHRTLNIVPCAVQEDLVIHSLSVQFSSVAQSCPTLRDPMNRSTPGLPVPHLPSIIQSSIYLLWFSCQVMSDSCNTMDCSPSGSSVHWISQARILEWVAIVCV